MSSNLKVASTKYLSKGSHKFASNQSLLLTVNLTDSARILRHAILEARLRVGQQEASLGILSLRCENILPELAQTLSSAHNACTHPLGVKSSRADPSGEFGGITTKHPYLARAHIFERKRLVETSVEFPLEPNATEGPVKTVCTSSAFKPELNGGHGLIARYLFPDRGVRFHPSARIDIVGSCRSCSLEERIERFKCNDCYMRFSLDD
jgi:hypothetical protein